MASASLLSWERGLKCHKIELSVRLKVAPLVGAWIEICMELNVSAQDIVAPLVGAWIEIIQTVQFQSQS